MSIGIAVAIIRLHRSVFADIIFDGIGNRRHLVYGITIANNVVIAAGAVVNKSCLEENVVLAGVPAKIVKKYEL